MTKFSLRLFRNLMTKLSTKSRRRQRLARTLRLETCEKRQVFAADAFVGVFNQGFWNLEDRSAEIAFGLPGDQPVMGDWNGDGVKTPGIFRNGTWVLDETGNGFDAGDRVLQFGLPGDKAVAGDWNGDGTDTVGVFRNGNFTFDKNGNGFDAADTDVIAFGWNTDTPVAGDWDGDGKDTVGIFRNGTWVLDLNGNGYDAADRVLQFGLPGAQGVVGDWNGDGTDTPGVLQSGQWYFDREGDGFSGETGTANTLGSGVAVSGSKPQFDMSDDETSQANAAATNESDATTRRVSAKPLAGKDINLTARGLAYNPNGGDRKQASVLVRITNPQRNSGTFQLQLFWASGADPSSSFFQLAGKKTVMVNRLKGDLRIDFGRQDLTARPDQASHLIAVVNGDRAVKETNTNDNVIAFELAPRTFIFRIAGFASSQGSGMEAMDLQSLRNNSTSQVVNLPVILPPRIQSGAAMLAGARTRIANLLASFNATAKDRVILIGHSYGGDIARRLASDVNPNLPGSQAAYSLVLIDPVDFELAESLGQTDQVQVLRQLPSNVNPNRVLVISGNPRRQGLQPVRGYRITGIRDQADVQALWNGDDRRGSTPDDLTHTSIDDSLLVHRKVVSFLANQIVRR